MVTMNRRLAAPDHSLNAPLRDDGDGEWQDWLVDETQSQETRLAESEELGKRQRCSRPRWRRSTSASGTS